MAKYTSFTDLSATFRKNPITGDVTELKDDASIKASVINLVMTMFYEHPFHPEIGSSVMESLFENVGPLTAIKIRKSIQDVLINFEPRVELLGVDVAMNADQNSYEATIYYRIVNQTNPVEVTLLLEKRR